MSKPSKGSTLPPVQSEAQTQVQPWQPKDYATNGAVVLQPGQDTGRKSKSGTVITSKALVVHLPKINDLTAAGMTREQAVDKLHAIGKAIKPAIMGRVVKASSDESYIVRRYSENPDSGAIGVALVKVKTTDKLAQIAAEYGLTREEVAKRLGVKDAVNIAA